MTMNMNQTKYAYLVMQLQIKTDEYKYLCESLEKFKQQNLDPNAKEYQQLLLQFEKNNQEIKEIKRQLKELK